jgi:hypothetical protein
MLACTQCGLPLDPEQLIKRRALGEVVCECCFWMLDAIVGRGFFWEAHREWEREQEALKEAQRKNINRLKPGADYFGKD